VPGSAIERLVEDVQQQSEAPIGAHRGLRASQRGTVAPVKRIAKSAVRTIAPLRRSPPVT